MTGVEDSMNSDMAESVKAVRAKEAEGQFLKSKGGAVEETDEEEEKYLNSADSESVVHIKSDVNSSEGNKGVQEHKKGILKHQRTFSNKHVDFNLDVEFVPFDESKDYTIEIQIVEQMPKKIVSYAALFAQQALKEQTKQQDNEQEKSSKSKKHCINCKSKKSKKQKQDSVPYTTAVKDVKSEEVKEEPNIKNSEECLLSEDVPNETSDDVQNESQQMEGESLMCEAEQVKEEVTEDCDCGDENGDHNELDCRECQNAKEEKLQVEENMVDNGGENKDSSEEQEKGQEPYCTEILNESDKINEENITEIRKKTEEGQDMKEEILTNEKEIKTNLELSESSNDKEEQLGFAEKHHEEVEHCEEDNIEEDKIKDNEENIATDDTLKCEETKETLNENQIEVGAENKCGSDDQSEKDDEISGDYYDTEENLNTHASQNETEDNTLSYSNEMQSDESVCEESKEFEEMPAPAGGPKNTSDSSSVDDTCTNPKNEPDQQCNEYGSNEESISEEVNCLDLETHNTQQKKTPLDVPVCNPKEQNGTHDIKLDEISDSADLDKLNSIHSQSCPENEEISNVYPNIDELPSNDLKVEISSNESENEVGKGDYIGQNDSNIVGSNKQLESLDEQQENQNLLECLPESVAGDGKISIKVDENNIPNQTNFCKMEAVGPSNTEINNSR